jgi:lipoprotein-anchoring transpeptidase ErfK/SrfK
VTPVGSLFLSIVMAFTAAGEVAERAPRCEPGSTAPMRSDLLAYAAVVRSSAAAYREPGRGQIESFGALNVNGHSTVFGVLGAVRGADCEALWYRVQLPVRPNGIAGYVRAADVEVIPVRTRIVVDLSDRTVALFEDGRKAVETPTAVGSAATPTPVGTFYVNQRLRASDPSGPWGPGGVGISAFSDVLTDWVQGGPVAIHGTNRPDTIGRAASNGCLRVRNDVLARIFALAMPGTPVLIRP